LHKNPKDKEMDELLKKLNKVNGRIRGTVEQTFAHLKHNICVLARAIKEETSEEI